MTGLVLPVLVSFLRSTPDGFPRADLAVIEIDVLHALRGFWKLGPYSQFPWHHPGPVYFYALVPFYLVAGQRTIGLVAGALAINLSSLFVIGWMAARRGHLIVAPALLSTLCIYLWRVDLAASIWNPHIVVVPMVALVVVCAALAAGDRAALPVATALGSFVVQTHLSVAPSVAALLMLAFLVVTIGDRHGGSRPSRLNAGLSIALACLFWLPTIVEEVRGRPGNLTRLWVYFFTERHTGQSWSTAFVIWADMVTAVVRRTVELGRGNIYLPTRSWPAAAAALAQLVLLGVAAHWARRSGRRFLASLCALSALASMVSCWSVTRIVDEVNDHQIFWISGIGTLSWGALVAVGATIIEARAPRVSAHVARWALFLVLAALSGVGVEALAHGRAYAVEQQGIDGPVQVLVTAVEQYLEREHIRRPLFRIAQSTWADATGVVLRLYKHRRPRSLAVEEPWIFMFGEPLSPNGREDAEFQFADPDLHAALSTQSGDRIIAKHDYTSLHLLVRKR